MNNKSFLKASSILFIGELLTRFVGFIYLKPLNSINDEIGFISGIIMQPYSFFLVFAMLGLTNILTIKLSQSFSKPNLYKKNFLDGASYILITSVLITVLLLIFAPLLIKQIAGDVYYIDALISSLRLLSLSIIFYAFNMLLKSTFFSQSKYAIVSITYVSEQILKVFLILVGCYILLIKKDLPIGISAYVISISTLFSILSTTLIMIIYGFKAHIFDPLKNNIKYKWHIRTFYSLLMLGGIYFINGLFVTGFMQVDISNMMNDMLSFGVSKDLAVTMIGDYTMWSWKLISLVISLGSVFIIVMVRHLSVKEKNSSKNEFNYILNILLIYSLLATVFFLSAGRAFYFWFYSNSNQMSIFILFSQALLIPFYLIRSQMSVYALTNDKRKSIIISTIALFAIKIILNPILFHYLFILGYILSSIIAIIISLIILLVMDQEIFNFTKKEFLYKIAIVIKMLIVLIITVLVSKLLLTLFSIEQTEYFITVIVQSTVLLITFGLVLSTDIRKMI